MEWSGVIRCGLVWCGVVWVTETVVGRDVAGVERGGLGLGRNVEDLFLGQRDRGGCCKRREYRRVTSSDTCRPLQQPQGDW